MGITYLKSTGFLLGDENVLELIKRLWLHITVNV